MLRFIFRFTFGIFCLALLAAAVAFVWWRFGDWEARAVKDVEFVHDTIMAHHPGPVDPLNPGFITTMDVALEKARGLAKQAKTPSDHHAALEAYTDSFRDGHLGLFFTDRIIQLIQRQSGGGSAATNQAELEIEDETAFISIPSFSEQFTPIAALTTEIESKAEELRGLDLIIFDLRGNGGGDSAFGNRIAIALWSEAVYLDWVAVSAQAIEWRASTDNTDHVRKIARKNERKGRPELAKAWERIADGIEQATAAGDDYYRQALRTRETTRTLESPVQGQVVVITDSSCASACLDFMDKLIALPDVVHIGEETGSDTQYMDIRMVTLPSKTGMLIIPLKVYRERLRPRNGTFVPQIPVAPSSITADTVESILASTPAL